MTGSQSVVITSAIPPVGYLTKEVIREKLLGGVKLFFSTAGGSTIFVLFVSWELLGSDLQDRTGIGRIMVFSFPTLWNVNIVPVKIMWKSCVLKGAWGKERVFWSLA